MDKRKVNFLVATRIMGLEPFPGSESDVVTPGMAIGGDGSPLHQTPMKPYDYCGRIDLAFDVATKLRNRVNQMGPGNMQGLHSLMVWFLMLIDDGDGWASTFYRDAESVEEWWEKSDELPYTAKDENPATAICLAALEAVGVTVTKGE